MQEMPKLVSLSDLVRTTADELRAIHNAEPKDAVMQFSGCEVELDVVAQADAKGKLKFWVVEAGAGVSYGNTQKVKLKFSPIASAPIQAAATTEGVAKLPKRQQ